MPKVDSGEFKRASHIVRNLAQQPKSGEFSKLYGLYKQATSGDCEISRPDSNDPMGLKKYNAWVHNRGMSRENAAHAYIAKAKEVGEIYGIKDEKPSTPAPLPLVEPVTLEPEQEAVATDSGLADTTSPSAPAENQDLSTHSAQSAKSAKSQKSTKSQKSNKSAEVTATAQSSGIAEPVEPPTATEQQEYEGSGSQKKSQTFEEN